jgi:hypothetical protein
VLKHILAEEVQTLELQKMQLQKPVSMPIGIEEGKRETSEDFG